MCAKSRPHHTGPALAGGPDSVDHRSASDGAPALRRSGAARRQACPPISGPAGAPAADGADLGDRAPADRLGLRDPASAARPAPRPGLGTRRGQDRNTGQEGVQIEVNVGFVTGMPFKTGFRIDRSQRVICDRNTGQDRVQIEVKGNCSPSQHVILSEIAVL